MTVGELITALRNFDDDSLEVGMFDEAESAGVIDDAEAVSSIEDVQLVKSSGRRVVKLINYSS